MPKHALKIRPKRIIRPVADLHAPEELSLDEQIAAKFQEVMLEAEQIEYPITRDLWMDAINTFVTSGDVSNLIDITRWRRTIVPLDEFLFGEAFLAQKRAEMFPGVVDALHDLDTDKFDEAVLMGSLGCGKTTVGNFSTIRDIYKLSCMRNPHDTYGIQSGTPIGFTIQSVRLGTAKKVVFDELGRLLRNSPYFKLKFPYDPYTTTELKFKEFNMSVRPVSSSVTGVISMNVLGGQLDEMNFQQKTMHSKSQHADEQGAFDQAKALYLTLAKRRKSRFISRGDLPGCLFVISSSRFPGDFTEEKAAQSAMRGGTDERIYVYHHSRWSVAPEQFGDERFRVQVGNTTFPSRVLKDGELTDPECEVIEVPVEFKDEFNQDPDGSLRDFAGATTMSRHPFFTQRQKIASAFNAAKEAGYLPIFPQEQYELSQGLPVPYVDRIRTDVQTWRHVHIDLGHKRDACGIAIGHLAGHKVKRITDPVTKEVSIDISPVIAYDLIMRVVPPRGGEIEFANIRKLLTTLRDRYKLPIKYVTTDGFQSVDTRQILRRQGFITDYLSVEKIESWRVLKDVMYGDRALIPASQWLSTEIAGLEQKPKNNKDHVDHRADGTKDVADAVCGVANFLMSRKTTWAEVRYLGATEGVFLLGDKSWQDFDKKPEYGSTAPSESNDISERRQTNRKHVTERKSVQRR